MGPRENSGELFDLLRAARARACDEKQEGPRSPDAEPVSPAPPPLVRPAIRTQDALDSQERLHDLTRLGGSRRVEIGDEADREELPGYAPFTPQGK